MRRPVDPRRDDQAGRRPVHHDPDGCDALGRHQGVGEEVLQGHVGTPLIELDGRGAAGPDLQRRRPGRIGPGPVGGLFQHVGDEPRGVEEHGSDPYRLLN